MITSEWLSDARRLLTSVKYRPFAKGAEIAKKWVIFQVTHISIFLCRLGFSVYFLHYLLAVFIKAVANHLAAAMQDLFPHCGTNKASCHLLNSILSSTTSFCRRLQRDAVRLRRRVRARPRRPRQGRVRVQEAGVPVAGGACVWLRLVHLLQRVRAGEGPVQHAAAHQGSAQGALL